MVIPYAWTVGHTVHILGACALVFNECKDQGAGPAMAVPSNGKSKTD